MTTRHAWTKLATHRYRCTRCGMDKTNAILPEPNERGWAQWETRFTRAGESWTGPTPPCRGAFPGPAAPALTWTRMDAYHELADAGERVSASPGADGRQFFAWGADVAPGLKYYEWPIGDQYHFKRGEYVPQRCALLGVFGSADEARAVCARDRARVDALSDASSSIKNVMTEASEA